MKQSYTSRWDATARWLHLWWTAGTFVNPDNPALLTRIHWTPDTPARISPLIVNNATLLQAAFNKLPRHWCLNYLGYILDDLFNWVCVLGIFYPKASALKHERYDFISIWLILYWFCFSIGGYLSSWGISVISIILCLVERSYCIFLKI